MQQLQGSSSFTISDLNLIVMIKNQNKKKKKPDVCQFETTAKINEKPSKRKGFFLLINETKAQKTTWGVSKFGK